MPSLRNIEFGQPLTNTESEVHDYVVKYGYNAKQIARLRYRSVSSVKMHLRVIYLKKGVRNAVQLVVKHYTEEKVNG